MAKTTCYLQLVPQFYSGGNVYRVTAQRVTTKKPSPPIPGALVVRLTLDVPDAAYLPLSPAAEIVIPVEHTEPIAVVSEPLEIVT